MDYKKKSSTSYSIKRVLKALFQKHLNNNNKKSNRNTRSMESLESLENYRNSQFEEHYEEIGDNAANEKLLSYIYNEVNSYNDHHKHHYNKTNINNHDHMLSSSTIPLTRATTDQVNEDEEEDIFVPVRFARTEVGTYFWTTNLQPAAIITTVTTPLGDNLDLIQPTICYTNYPQLQFQDRWAQA